MLVHVCMIVAACSAQEVSVVPDCVLPHMKWVGSGGKARKLLPSVVAHCMSMQLEQVIPAISTSSCMSRTTVLYLSTSVSRICCTPTCFHAVPCHARLHSAACIADYKWRHQSAERSSCNLLTAYREIRQWSVQRHLHPGVHLACIQLFRTGQPAATLQ